MNKKGAAQACFPQGSGHLFCMDDGLAVVYYWIMNREKMPVLFVGHGSPMNALEDNEFSRGWEDIAKRFPKPRAIVCISAHWYTEGWRVNDSPKPRQVYDMYGFPEALYHLTWPVNGNPALADRLSSMTGSVVDNSWGCDHGAWSVLRRMYPLADIPFFQLSVNRKASFAAHYAMGRNLKDLRNEGVLVVGSGNVVHNLSMLDWEMQGGYPWAVEYDGNVKESIRKGDHDAVVQSGESSRLALPTPEHFLPLLCVLGASQAGEKVTVFNDRCVLGSLSMTSYLIGG